MFYISHYATLSITITLKKYLQYHQSHLNSLLLAAIALHCMLVTWRIFNKGANVEVKERWHGARQISASLQRKRLCSLSALIVGWIMSGSDHQRFILHLRTLSNSSVHSDCTLLYFYRNMLCDFHTRRVLAIALLFQDVLFSILLVQLKFPFMFQNVFGAALYNTVRVIFNSQEPWTFSK